MSTSKASDAESPFSGYEESMSSNRLSFIFQVVGFFFQFMPYFSDSFKAAVLGQEGRGFGRREMRAARELRGGLIGATLQTVFSDARGAESATDIGGGGGDRRWWNCPACTKE